jgi:hypothetical protein
MQHPYSILGLNLDGIGAMVFVRDVAFEAFCWGADYVTKVQWVLREFAFGICSLFPAIQIRNEEDGDDGEGRSEEGGD